MNAERLLRRIRQRVFDYPPEKEAQVDRVLNKLKARVIANRVLIKLHGTTGLCYHCEYETVDVPLLSVCPNCEHGTVMPWNP
jgi:hypothetical protein